MERVLFITSCFRPEPGSLEGLCTGIARNWPSGELAVLVAARPGDSLGGREETSRFDEGENYPIQRASPGRFSRGFRRGDKSFAQTAREILRLRSPRHILFGNAAPGIDEILRVARKYSLPYSIIVNGAEVQGRLNSRRPSSGRSLVQGAQTVFTLTESITKALLDRGVSPRKIVELPPVLDKENGVMKFARKKLPVPPEARRDRLIILGTGPFLPRKSMDRALEALRLLKNRRDLHLVLTGSGPEFHYLEELIRLRGLEENVSMTGFLSPEELAAWYQRADIFLQPAGESEEDLGGMGASLMEAACFSRPIIAGASAAARRILQDGTNGLLIPEGAIEKLAEKIELLADSPGLRETLGRAAGRDARNRFDLREALRLIRGPVLDPVNADGIPYPSRSYAR